MLNDEGGIMKTLSVLLGRSIESTSPTIKTRNSRKENFPQFTGNSAEVKSLRQVTLVLFLFPEALRLILDTYC